MCGPAASVVLLILMQPTWHNMAGSYYLCAVGLRAIFFFLLYIHLDLMSDRVGHLVEICRKTCINVS